MPSSPYTVPRARWSGSAIALAVAMHVLLAAFLYFGVNWQSHAPDVVNAELWSALPQIAAPAPSQPPQPVPAPQPQPKVIQPEPPAPLPAPDIAIKAPPVKKPPKPKEPPPPEQREVQKVQPKPSPKRELAEPKTPPRPSKNEMDRLNRLISSDSAVPSSGTSAQTSGQRGDDDYGTRIKKAIYDQLKGSPPANYNVEVELSLLPDGEVSTINLTRSSGDPAFDAAIQRAISSASPLPRRKDGTVARNISLTFRQGDPAQSNHNF